MKKIRGAIVAMSLSVLGALPACGGDSEECKNEKLYVCDRVQDFSCSTAFMTDAIARLETECGKDEADRWVPEAEAACASLELDQCTEL